MRLTIQDVDLALNQRIQNYIVHEKRTYHELRSDCLSMAPILSVKSDLSIMLEQKAKDDITQHTQYCTQRAHASQQVDDLAEDDRDRLTAAKCEREIKILNQQVSSLNAQLAIVVVTHLLYQGEHSGARTKLEHARFNLRKMHNTYGHQHGHSQLRNNHHEHSTSQHSHSHSPLNADLIAHAEHQVRMCEAEERRQYEIFFQHETTKNKIERDLRSYQSQISDLEKQQAQLNVRARERNKRCFVREKYPNELHRDALSNSNASLLDKDINTQTGSINDLCRQMKNAVTARCYDAFLTQLECNIEALPFSNNEKNALKMIIAKMHEHQHDVAFRKQQQDKLAGLKNSLRLSQERVSDKNSEIKRLTVENQNLAQSNERLQSEYIAFQGQYQQSLEQRNRFATFSVAATAVTAVSSITGYFLLQAGVLAIVPGVNLALAMVAGVTILALGITCCIAAVQASYAQADSERCQQNIVDNEHKIRINNSVMNKSQQNDVPELLRSIEMLGHAIDVQTLETKNAVAKAELSKKQAHEIDVVGLCSANSYGRLFTDSAANIAVALPYDDNIHIPVADAIYPSAPPPEQHSPR